MLFYNPTYMLFMLPAILLMLITQWYVNSAYKKWSRVPTRGRMTGREVAQRLISSSGLYNVQIDQVQGRLSDHYDPRTKVLRLSPAVANGDSVAALAIAAHELGHAMQDNENYGPLRLRSAIVPAVNIGSYLGWILILLGLFLGLTSLAWLGVFVFSGGALFALATLPVEFNASARAKQMLSDSGFIVEENERRGVNSVLNAAALTYVAALVTPVLQLLYYVTLVLGMNRRR